MALAIHQVWSTARTEVVCTPQRQEPEALRPRGQEQGDCKADDPFPRRPSCPVRAQMSGFLYVTYQQTLCSLRQLMARALVVPVSKGLEFLSSSNWCSWGGGGGGVHAGPVSNPSPDSSAGKSWRRGPACKVGGTSAFLMLRTLRKTNGIGKFPQGTMLREISKKKGRWKRWIHLSQGTSNHSGDISSEWNMSFP